MTSKSQVQLTGDKAPDLLSNAFSGIGKDASNLLHQVVDAMYKLSTKTNYSFVRKNSVPNESISTEVNNKVLSLSMTEYPILLAFQPEEKVLSCMDILAHYDDFVGIDLESDVSKSATIYRMFILNSLMSGGVGTIEIDEKIMSIRLLTKTTDSSIVTCISVSK